eukprot:7822630-Lingulodinium_polyedra.AAC.1
MEFADGHVVCCHVCSVAIKEEDTCLVVGNMTMHMSCAKQKELVAKRPAAAEQRTASSAHLHGADADLVPPKLQEMVEVARSVPPHHQAAEKKTPRTTAAMRAQLPLEISQPAGDQKTWMVSGSNDVKIMVSCDPAKGGHYYIKHVEKKLRHVSWSKFGGAHPAWGEAKRRAGWV